MPEHGLPRARIRPGTRDIVEFLADSDSEVVRGLLALLQLLFSGRRAGDLLAFDLPHFLARAGLDANLTTGRRNGLAAMIKRSASSPPPRTRLARPR